MFLIKPLKDNVVNPDTGAPLEPRGIKVSEIGSFWFRRARDHDVSITEVEDQKVSSAEKKPSTSEQNLKKEKGV